MPPAVVRVERLERSLKVLVQEKRNSKLVTVELDFGHVTEGVGDEEEATRSHLADDAIQCREGPLQVLFKEFVD